MRDKDLFRLKRVTEAAWLAASQDLRAKAGEERAVAARLHALTEDRERYLRQVTEGETFDLAQVQSAGRWMRWAEREATELNMWRARIRVDMEIESGRAKTAFARDQAMAKLLARRMPGPPTGD